MLKKTLVVTEIITVLSDGAHTAKCIDYLSFHIHGLHKGPHLEMKSEMVSNHVKTTLLEFIYLLFIFIGYEPLHGVSEKAKHEACHGSFE